MTPLVAKPFFFLLMMTAVGGGYDNAGMMDRGSMGMMDNMGSGASTSGRGPRPDNDDLSAVNMVTLIGVYRIASCVMCD